MRLLLALLFPAFDFVGGHGIDIRRVSCDPLLLVYPARIVVNTQREPLDHTAVHDQQLVADTATCSCSTAFIGGRVRAAYQAVPKNDTALIARLKALGEQYPRYGYLMLHAMLRNEGLVVNRKRTYRV